jgi:hypothetical protein
MFSRLSFIIELGVVLIFNDYISLAVFDVLYSTQIINISV